MDQVRQLKPLDDPTISLGFVQTILSSLRQEIDNDTTLLGFVGSPWTLAAYAMEGKADRHCLHTKVRGRCTQLLLQSHLLGAARAPQQACRLSAAAERGHLLACTRSTRNTCMMSSNQ